jgi:hypothetical protein
MRSSALRKRQAPLRVRVSLEELEGRALLSSVQPLPLWHTAYSTNWSGYAAETNLSAPASNAVTQVSGSWTVPTVTGRANAYSSVWVGIDGYSSGSVEQLGTEQDTSNSGATSYYAWWEMYPNPSVRITSMTISPGNSISASVAYNSGAYTLQIKDNTTGQTFSTNQAGTFQRSSAEWVVEAPSSFSGVLPLANFGTATITGAQAIINGVTGAIDNASWQHTAIDMVTQSGTLLDQALGLTDTTASPVTSSFSVTYSGSSSGGGGHGHGHGPIEFFAPEGLTQPVIQALAMPVANSDPKSEPLTKVTAQDGVVLAPLAEGFVPQIDEHGSASGLKTWRST